MAVAYDNSATIDGFGIATLTTGSFTIGSGANRAALLGLGIYSATASAISGTCAGTSGSIITGTTEQALSMTSILIGVTAPASGSKTAHAQWTTSASASLGVITATGVNQTTPFNNGTANSTGTGSCSVTVTSNSGYLTSTVGINSGAGSNQTTNQTKKTTDFACMDIGPGTGSTTHTWTGTSNNNVSGANFAQVSSNSGALFRQTPMTGLGVGGPFFSDPMATSGRFKHRQYLRRAFASDIHRLIVGIDREHLTDLSLEFEIQIYVSDYADGDWLFYGAAGNQGRRLSDRYLKTGLIYHHIPDEVRYLTAVLWSNRLIHTRCFVEADQSIVLPNKRIFMPRAA